MSLFDVFSSSGGKKAAADANAARTTGLRTGYDKASALYDEGLAGATTQYERAAEPFGQFVETGVAGNKAYGDAIGLGGEEGYGRAVEMFQANPGYEFAMESGLDAIDRRASARGMLGSGNTNTDSITFSQGLANQEYQNWLNNLNTASQGGQQAAGTQAGIFTGLGDKINQTGTNKGNLAYDVETGVGNSTAQMIADQQAAKQAASGNIWNAIFGVGDLAAKFMGGGLPGGGGDAGQGSWAPVVTRN